MTTLNLEPFADALELAVSIEGINTAYAKDRQMSFYRHIFGLPAGETPTGRLPQPLKFKDLPGAGTRRLGSGDIESLPGVVHGRVVHRNPNPLYAAPKVADMLFMGLDLGAPEGDKAEIVVLKSRKTPEGEALMKVDWSSLERRVAAMMEPPPVRKPKGDVFTRIAAQNLKKPYDAVTPQERGGAKASWSLLLYTKDGERTLKAVHGEKIMADDWEDRYAVQPAAKPLAKED